jgi:hypothetical protein
MRQFLGSGQTGKGFIMNNRENRNGLPSSQNSTRTSRREFLATGGKVLAASAVLPSILPGLYAAEDNTIRLALIGCGGRGTGFVIILD